jgi:putative glutathione S-transferase
MGKMLDGEWIHEDDWTTDDEGQFQRSETTFRDWVKADGSTDYEPESGRYHLYVSYACPWAHRTLITRKLRGLEDSVSVSVVAPFMGEDGWEFDEEVSGATEDHLYGSGYLREVYREAKREYTGRVTVPVLWDKKKETIVNNESREIVRMFDVEFDEVAEHSEVDLYPEGYREEIEETIDAIYQPINNGVYRAGFATSQEAYETAVDQLFDAFDHWEEVLENQRYLCGDRLTEADICMFTTLYRFDAVYHVHFKCSTHRLIDYPNLWGYARDLFQTDDFRETCNMRHIREHYYRSHETVNPRRVIAREPEMNWDAPHRRESLSE